MDGLVGLIALVTFVVLFVVIALTLHLGRQAFWESLGAAIATPVLAHGRKGRPA